MGSDPVPHAVIAAESFESESQRSSSLKERHRDDPCLVPFIYYLEDGTSPEEDKESRVILLSQSNYTLLDDVLYHVEPDKLKALCIIPTKSDRKLKKLWEELHSGCCGGHLKCAKRHGQLSKHYWWPGMRTDIVSWCRGCIVCATRNIGQSVKTPLIPIPVGGPFDQVGVDVIKFPKSGRGHQYAVIFVDYLT